MASQADDTNTAAPADASASSQPKASPTSPTSPTASAAAAAARLHRPIMQSLPDTRQQSFDEIYGPPENFLEIEVRPHPPCLPSSSLCVPLCSAFALPI
jgi:sorting nexin-3/12